MPEAQVNGDEHTDEHEFECEPNRERLLRIDQRGARADRDERRRRYDHYIEEAHHGM